MHKPLLWFTLLLSTSLVMPLQAEQLTGKWRGKLQMTPQAALIIGININRGPNGHTLTLDSPNQAMFDYSPSEFKIEGSSVQFQDNKLNARFNGTLQDGQLRGEFSQGKTLPLNLTLLDEAQQTLLANEGSWFGDLIINNSARLPLVLNIAVADKGYYVTLDSPKQQSFGIPVEKFSLNADSLEFSSAMIKASYSATWQDDSWRGTFVQASAIPLVLKKKAELTNEASPTLADIDRWLPAEFGHAGAAVAIISHDDTRFYLHGFADHAKQQPVNKQTLFEIGSVTKPLVGLLTALAVVKQQLTLDTTVAAILQQPAYQQHQYSVAQLLSHQSGLPRLPANLPLTDLTDPYAQYTQADLMAALQQMTPGEQQFEYSNFGYGLLAELISQQQGQNFAALIQQQLFSPLGMTASTVALTEGNYSNRAQGHQFDGSQAANWHFRALAGAGAILSSIEDMAALVQHYLHAAVPGKVPRSNGDNAPLFDAMRLSLTPATTATDIGLGWMLQPNGLIWHNGQTGGFNAFVGFAPAEQVGIVILANTTNPVTPGGMALLQQLRRQANTTITEPPEQ